MARPFKADRPIRQEIYLPESVHNKLTLLLLSPAEGRVPRGAWSLFFETLARQALDRLNKETSNASEPPQP